MVKEMIYKERMMKAELLANDTYKRYEYVVLSLGTHPCAYVVLDDDDKLFGMDYDEIHENYDVYCHCGLTYSEDYLSFLEFSNKYRCDVKIGIHNKWVIGWDYAHYGDYAGYCDELGGKKWSTAEMIGECKEFIDQLIVVNG